MKTRYLCVLLVPILSIGYVNAATAPSTRVESTVLQTLRLPSSSASKSSPSRPLWRSQALQEGSATPVAVEEKKTLLTIGGAFADPQSGADSWNTPFTLQIPVGKAGELSFQGDGFKRVSGSGAADGFTDPTLLYKQGISQLSNEVGSALLIGGVTFPVHGDVGTRHYAQRVLGVYQATISEKVAIAFIGGVVRNDEKPSVGSRFGQIAGTQLLFGPTNLQQGQQWSLELINSHQNGTKDVATAATLSHEYPLKASVVGLRYTRGLRGGQNENGFQIDFKFPL